MLITAGLIGIGATIAVYRHTNKEEIEKQKKLKAEEKEFRSKWNLTLKYNGKMNKAEQTFEVLKYIPREHYGCDAIVSIPLGLNFHDLYEIKHDLENAFGGQISMEWVRDSKCAYLRVANKVKELSFADKLKFQWDGLMTNGKLKTFEDKTFKIEKLLEKEYGCDIELSIPNGLSYRKLEEYQHTLEGSLGALIYMEWQQYERKIIMHLINKPIEDNRPFVPVKIKPYEFYIGMTHYYENPIVNLNLFPMILISGATGMGKSFGMQSYITNLLYWNDNVNIFLAELSDKPDFEPFKNCKQVKYYAMMDIKQVVKIFKYVLNLKKQRNQTFKDKGVRNIETYNKMFPHQQLKYTYIFMDEFAEFMPKDKENDPNYGDKRFCYEMINLIAKEGRSAGIFLVAGIQRPDTCDMLANLKMNFNVKVCYSQNNKASSLVVCDSDDAVGLPQREALLVYGDKRIRYKTLFLDDDLIKKYLKDKIEINHEYLNLDNQFNEQSVQTSKNNKTSSKTEKSNTHSEPPVATNRIKNANKGGKK